MGKTHEALMKAETQFQKEFGNNSGRRAVCKPGKPNRTYIVLTILGLFTVMIAGYVYGRINGKLSASDVEVLQNAQTRIAQLDRALELTNRNFVELEKRLHESEKYVEEEQKARESQKEELLNNKAMVKTLQEKLKTAHFHESRIAQLDRELDLKNRNLVALEKRLQDSEKYVKEEQKARESQKEELLNNKAMVKTLQEKLKTAQSRQLNLQDEFANSKREIKALRVQLAEIKKSLASTEAISPQTLAPEKRSEAAPSFNIQKDFETDISDQPADDGELKSPYKNSDLAFSAKAVSTADSDPLPAKEQSQDPEQRQPPDPGQIIDWLLKKQAQ